MAAGERCSCAMAGWSWRWCFWSARADLVVVEYHCRLRCAATGDFSTLFSGGGRAAGGALSCWETCAQLLSRHGSGWCVAARRFGTAVSFPRWTAGILYTDGCCWERDGAMRRQRLFFSVRRFRGAWRVTLGWLARLRLPYGAVRLPPGSGRVAECAAGLRKGVLWGGLRVWQGLFLRARVRAAHMPVLNM